MRIAFVNPIGQIGGAERSLLDLMASLGHAESRWQLHLIVGEPGPLVNACKSIGVQAHVLALPQELQHVGDAGLALSGQKLFKAVLLGRLAFASVAAARYVCALRRLLIQLNPDLIHTNGFKMHTLGAWAKPPGTALVWHIHDYVSSRVVMVKLLRMLAGRCSAAIANSASVATDFQAAMKSRVAVHKVWNAIDLNEFSPEGTKLDLDTASGLFPAGDDVVRVGLVATLAKWKGHSVFLRALSMLPRNIPVRGYVIGDSIYQSDSSQWRLDDLKKQATELGLAGRVGFTGFVARSAEAMRSLDVVVHASTRPEPFGLVIAEAMGCRRALIVSRSGGAEEIIQHDANALAHSPGNAMELAELIVKLAGDCQYRERLGKAGRQTAEREFDRARLGLQLAPIYRTITSPNRSRAA
jgi:glycosyltransferase involved in cell wall biosynthesis